MPLLVALQNGGCADRVPLFGADERPNVNKFLGFRC
jgi:hypothetical protein